MKKIGNKGFMMAEVVIVSCIILVSLVGLYATFNKLYIAYTERSYYYNVDCVYALRNVYKKLVDDNEFVNLVNDNVINSGIEIKAKLSDNYYTGLFNSYKVNEVYLVSYKKDSVSNLVDVVSNDSFKEYIKYLANSLEYDEEDENYEDFSYMFIVEIKDKDYLYYGNYRVR